MNYAISKNAPIEQFMKKDIVSFSEEDSALEIAEYFLVNNSVYQVPILKKRKVVMNSKGKDFCSTRKLKPI